MHQNHEQNPKITGRRSTGHSLWCEPFFQIYPCYPSEMRLEVSYAQAGFDKCGCFLFLPMKIRYLSRKEECRVHLTQDICFVKS